MEVPQKREHKNNFRVVESVRRNILHILEQESGGLALNKMKICENRQTQ